MLILQDTDLVTLCAVCLLNAITSTALCGENMFMKFTNFTVSASSSSEMTATNVLVCMKNCKNNGFNVLYSFSQDANACKCYPWPTTLHMSASDQEIPLFISGKYQHLLL